MTDRVALRVRWSGADPQTGGVLLSAHGRVGYLIRRVEVLHHAANSNRPRLKLTVSRLAPDTIPANSARYAWSRTAARVLAPAPPAPSRKQAHPMPAAEASDLASKLARERRLAAEAAAPQHADESRWDDPADSVKTRTPKQVRGYRRGDVVGRMYRRGTDVTRDMLLGAQAFRVDYDIARLGLTAADPLADKVGGAKPGPTTGPSAAAVQRAVAERKVRKLCEALGTLQTAMLLHVVVRNRTIAEWVRDLDPAGKTSADREKKAFGLLLAVLARVAEWHGFDERRDALKRARAS